IRANYLSDPHDMERMVAGVRVARMIAAAKAFDPYRGGELCPGADSTDDRALRSHVEKYTETLYHPSGTCQMGSATSSVVDSELRVHGLDGLRVVDASVMPVIPGGNTNAPTIMIAEKAADLIRGRVRDAREAENALSEVKI